MSSLLTRLVLLLCYISVYLIIKTYAVATPTSTTLATTTGIKNTDTILKYKCGIHKPGGLLQLQKIDTLTTPKVAITNSTTIINENLNNVKAGLGEFPWTVAIYDENVIICAGSLILPNVVLTAGNCVKEVKKENLNVKAGLWDTTAQPNEKYPVKESLITQIIIHPEYKFLNHSIENDIALLILEKPFELSDHIGLACLANKDHKEKSAKCYVTGWGNENIEKNTRVNILKKLHLPFVTRDVCEKKLKEKMSVVALNENTICAGGDKASTCLGDAGAPLVCQITSNHHPVTPSADKQESRYIQSGINSWAILCKNELPGVFTNIPKYRDWIDENIKKLGGDTNMYTVVAA